MRAQFAMVETDHKHNIIFIEDIANHTGGCTITNDAEAVFQHITAHFSNGGVNRRVVYKDTENEWWEIVPVHSKSSTYARFERWNGYVWDALKGNV